MANGIFGGGDGTEANPFVVEDAADLNAVRNNITAHYRQSKDIDLSIYTNWVPIGQSTPFGGVYDGRQYKIKNLKCLTNTNYNALFGRLTNATMKNIRMETVNMSGGYYTGTIGGHVKGSIFLNCRVDNATVSAGYQDGSWWTGDGGGFIGKAEYSTFEDCHVAAEVTGAYCGGFGGDSSDSQLKNCIANVVIHSVPNTNQVGGFFAGMRTYDTSRPAKLEKCAAKVKFLNITGRGEVGGIVGSCEKSHFINCYVFIETGGRGWYVGGIGGLVHASHVTNSYVTGSLEGLIVGGIFASIYTITNGVKCTISNSYVLMNEMESYGHLGPEENTTSTFGDIVGDSTSRKRVQVETSPGVFEWVSVYEPIHDYTISNSYVAQDIETNKAYTEPVESLPISRSDAKTKNHYVLQGWDFNTVWKILEGVTYPIFENKCRALPLQSIALVN